jgi:four helix bundle protein
MERAAISVLSNFAEGFERDGNAEFVQFLTISKGSIGELRGQLIYSLDVGLIDEALQTELDDQAATATRMVGGLIRYLSGTELVGRKIRTTGRKQVKPPSPATPQPLTSNCKP